LEPKTTGTLLLLLVLDERVPARKLFEVQSSNDGFLWESQNGKLVCGPATFPAPPFKSEFFLRQRCMSMLSPARFIRVISMESWESQLRIFDISVQYDDGRPIIPPKTISVVSAKESKD
jgi:hypothetical protein